MAEHDVQARERPTHPPQDKGAGSMHEGVQTWDDTCSCEAEPGWQAVGEELEEQNQCPPDRREHLASPHARLEKDLMDDG